MAKENDKTAFEKMKSIKENRMPGKENGNPTKKRSLQYKYSLLFEKDRKTRTRKGFIFYFLFSPSFSSLRGAAFKFLRILE